jgi:hypothetical protein
VPGHGTTPSVGRLAGRPGYVSRIWVPNARLPLKRRAEALGPHGAAGAHAHSPHASATAERIARRPRGRYPPRRRADLTVSRCERGAFRRNDRTATEERVRSPSWVSAFRAETERGTGFEPATSMIHSHVLYQAELSSRLVDHTGIEPAPPGLPGALHELLAHPSFGGTRPRIAHRASQVYELGHKASRRRRASNG